MPLTPNQAAAVDYDRNLILFAGPGSGKTATSVEKCLRILGDPGARLCMVTFTTAAAQEMRERMVRRGQAAQTPSFTSRLICGTFNSITLQHYRKHAKQVRRMIPPPARTAMLNAMLPHLSSAERKEYLLALDKYQGALHQADVEFDDPAHEEFIREYHDRLESSRSTDLAMIMRDCATQMACGSLPLLPITHLLGDEMQDADQVQLEFMLAHTRHGIITTLVADDDQTIYEWRSALGYAGLKNFRVEAQAKVIALSENFRSREEVVSHATTLIALNNPERIDKDQRATRGPGGRLGYECFADLDHQCAFVTKYVLDERRPGETVAVLARTNMPLKVMGRQLNEAAISYVQSWPTLWEQTEVVVLTSMLQALINHSTTSLHPVLSVLPLDTAVQRDFERKLGHDATSFLRHGLVPDLDHGTALDKEFLENMARQCQSWLSLIHKGELDILVPGVVDQVYEWISRSPSYAKQSAGQRKWVREAFEDVESILLRLKGTLSQRLQIVGRLQDKEHSDDAVRLCTMHGSKGLEFDTVFLIDACDGDDTSQLVHDDAERRLFYVALTRAKDNFFALYSDVPTPYIHQAELPPL
jgi:superfamily I DNA/RNA helicase